MRILLATDFSASAEVARALLSGLTLPAGSTIRVVHAIEPVPELATLPVDTVVLAAQEAIAAELEKVAAPLRAPGVTVETAIGVGRAADVVIEESAATHADLIVIGSRGRGGFVSAVLGSVSAEVVDRAGCPVLVVRRPALTRVVLADDGSDTADAGARLVGDWPIFKGIPVRVVSVVDAPFPYAVTGDDGASAAYAAVSAYYDSLPLLRDAHARIARERATKLVTAGVEATAETREGDAATAIAEAAADANADCVVIGSHGRTGLRRLMIGSVARGVLFQAHCSVLVTKVGTAELAKEPRAELVGAAR